MKRSLVCIASVMLIAACSEMQPDSAVSEVSDAKVFTATIEGEQGTKVYVDGQNRLYWNENDLVSIFTRGLNEKYRFSGQTGDIGGTFEFIGSTSFGTGSQMDANYAVYPYYSDTKIDYEGNVTLTIPDTQYYKKDSFGLGANLMVAVTEDSQDTFLPFKNTCGYLAVKLFGQATVKKVIFEGNNDEPLAGKVSIKASHTALPELTVSASGSKKIILDCGSGVTVGKTKDEAVAFWIVVPPMTFTKGFTITTIDVNGQEYVKSSTKEQIIKRNICKDMSPVQINSAYPAVNVTEVSLDQTTLTFTEAGQQIQLNATVYPENATNKRVFWTSFDESVATVDENGVVTAVGNGETKIEVTTEDGDKKADAIARVDWVHPTFESAVFQSSTIDVTTDSQELIIDFHITDASGIADGVDTYAYCSGHEGFYHGTFSRVSGDAKDGYYRACITIPANVAPGSWTAVLKNLKDINGNQCWEGGPYSWAGSFTVVNNNGNDNEHPAIESAVFQSSTIDVTTDSQELIIDFHITDASGIADGVDTYAYCSGHEGFYHGTFSRVSGDAKDGYYRACITIPANVAPGSWTAVLKNLKDINGNQCWEGGPYSWAGSFTVVNNN